MKNYLLLTFVIIFTSCSSSYDGVDVFGGLYGTVVEENTGTSVHNVSITLSPVGYSTVTGTDGRYEFVELESQQYTITAYKSGYQSDIKTITVLPGQNVSCDFILRTGSSSLYADPTSLDFSSSKSQMVFDIINESSVSTGYTVSVPSGGWCSASPLSGTLQASNGTQGITVTIDRDLITTDKTENIIITADNGGSATVQISVDYESSSDSGSGSDSTTDLSEISVTNGLWAYYTFDDENMNDSWENGMNGLIENTATYLTNTPNGSGKAIKLGLNSDNQLVKARVPYNPFSSKTEYSYCFWVKEPSQGLIMNAYGNNTNSNTANYPVVRIYDSKLYACFNSYSISDYFNYNTATTLQDGSWHHVAVSITNNSQILYVDGTRVSTQQESVGMSTSSEIHFGGELYGYEGSDMKIDNIRIYSRTISASDVLSIYNSEK